MERITDAHVHCHAPGLAGEAMERLAALGIGRAAMLSYGHMRTDEAARAPGNSNAAVLAAKSLLPDRVYAFGGVNHLPARELDADAFGRELASQARRLHEDGFDGVKLLEGKPSLYVTFPYPLGHPVFEGFFAELEARSVPVLWHVADPARLWDRERAPESARRRGWYYGDGGYPSKEALHAEALAVLARHPRLRVIFAHFFFLSAELDRLGGLLDAHEGMHLDITPGTEMYRDFSDDPERSRAFFLRYGDRIVFGTDAVVSGDRFDPEPSERKVGQMRRFLETGDAFEDGFSRKHPSGRSLQGLALPEEVLRKVYRANFERLAGAEPGPLDRGRAIEACDRLAALVPAGAPNPAAEARRLLAGAVPKEVP